MCVCVCVRAARLVCCVCVRARRLCVVCVRSRVVRESARGARVCLRVCHVCRCV